MYSVSAVASWAAVIAVAVSCLPARGQDVSNAGAGPKSFEIARGAAPILDGRLDEVEWQTAASIEDFHEVEPNEYTSPSQRTMVRIYYDDDALYVGARMLDAGAITANTLRQGAQFWGDDYFTVVVAPFNDQRNGYRFQINPNGIRMEMIFFETSRQDWNWNGIWHGAASVDDEGWTAEMAIPFQTLSFHPENDTWGINFGRDIARVSESVGWVSRNAQQNPNVAGEAIGLEGLQLGRGLDIVPSLALRQTKAYDSSGGDSAIEPSLDVFYKITPSINGALTLNTDFSATEVDDRQVELTRFNLFFPEKRTFFLRDSDFFRFGRVGGRLGFGLSGTSTLSQPDLENGRPYFSRRIGLGANGAIVDFSYNNSRLPGGRLIQADAWYQESDTQGVDADQAAYGLRLRTPNTLGWRGGISVKEIEENFFPALGFVNRSDIRDHTYELGYSRRVGGGFFRTVFSGIDAERIDFLNGDLQTQVVTLRALEFDTNGQDQGNFRLHQAKENLIDPFVVWQKGADQIVIPQGVYSFDEASFSISTGDLRRVWATLSYRSGDFFNGTRDRTGVGIGWRPSNHFQFTLDYDFNEVDLPYGNFNTRLVQLRTDVIFSATASWSTLIQYDNVSESMGVNTRFNWIPEAGREIFVVLNHNLQDLDLNNRFESALADFAIKLNYTFRY